MPQHPNRKLLLSTLRVLVVAVLLVVVALGSCKEDEPIVLPQVNPCLNISANEPTETSWTTTLKRNDGDATLMGDKGEWIRGSGYIFLGESGGIGTTEMTIAEPAVASEIGCGVKITSLSHVGFLEAWELVPGTGALLLGHISNRAIRATGEASVSMVGGNPDSLVTLKLQFDIVKPSCSDGSGPPGSSTYSIGIASSASGPADRNYSGTKTRWDRNISLIGLGPDTTSSGGEFGMVIKVLEPVRASADSCVLTVTDAQFQYTDDPDHPTVVDFFVYPREDGDNNAENKLLTVFLVNDVVISAKGRIPMQRHDAYGWQEKVWVDVDFNAFEPGY